MVSVKYLRQYKILPFVLNTVGPPTSYSKIRFQVFNVGCLCKSYLTKAYMLPDFFSVVSVRDALRSKMQRAHVCSVGKELRPNT